MIAPEIVDHVLSFLQTDYATLKTCSAVFPQIVDRHLYSHITICNSTWIDSAGDLKPGYYNVNPAKFHMLLIKRPQIAFYVLGVRITLHRIDLEHLSAVSRILSILARIKSIELGADWESLMWELLPSDFCIAFQNSLRLPSLEDVSICDMVGFPLASFDGCKSLRNLHLSGIPSFRDGEEATTSSYPRLSSLRLENFLPVGRHDGRIGMTRIASWMKTNTLHTLSLRIDSFLNFDRLKMVIGACFTTLVNLELDYASYFGRSTMYRHWFLVQTIILEGLQLPALKRLIVRSPFRSAYLESTNPEHGSALPYFSPFLIALSHTCSPRSVHLSVHLRFNDVPNFDVQWREMSLLNELSGFRHPIELHLQGVASLIEEIGPLFRRSSDIRRLLEDGELSIVEDRLAI